MRKTARRAVIGTAVGVILALTAVTGVSAFWQAQQRVDLSAVGSGDLSISADWLSGTPAWPDLYPGRSTPDTVIRVRAAGAGDTLVWRLRVTGATSASFAAHTTFHAWIGPCGGSTPIPVEGAGAFTATTTTVDVCVRYALNASAPSNLQGTALEPAITVIAEQVTG